MKKTLVVGLAIGVFSMVASSAFAKSADGGAVVGTGNGGTGIVGTKHDLSFGAGLGADAQSRICVYCHHPHNALKANSGTGVTAMGSYSPLWNRNMSTKTFTAYNNGTTMMGNASTSQHTLNAGSNALKGVSLLCMSCHDGVVGMNAYSVNSGSTFNKGVSDGTDNITTTAAFGGGSGDMSNHHPMGFNYQTVQSADNEIAAPTVQLVPGGATIGSLLDGGNMECVTCHDVHNTANQVNAERFLWRTNDKSNFCLTCHLK